MEKRYKIDLPKGGALEVETPPDFFKLPFVMLSIAKRMSGKTCSMSNFLHILHKMDRLDRLILVSPTYHNNQHYFNGLPLDPLIDVIEPTVDSAQIVMDKMEEEGRLYDEYIDKIKRWKELMKLVKYSKTNIDDIDDNLFYDLNELLEKPTYRYMREGKPYKPVVVVFFDDCQNTMAFSPRSKVSYLTIKHRHVGKTVHGSIGVNLMFACQNYTSNSGGIPKTIRGNTTILCVFKNKNQKELDLISEECSGECDSTKFMQVFTEATDEDYGFLTIDFNRKKQHPSMFRKCWNRWLI
jgi:hypothetical protein